MGVGVAEGLGEGEGDGATDGLTEGLGGALTAGLTEALGVGVGDRDGDVSGVGVAVGDGELVSPRTSSLAGKKIDFRKIPEPIRMDNKIPESMRVGLDGLVRVIFCIIHYR